jgi:hypothetical protein
VETRYNREQQNNHGELMDDNKTILSAYTLDKDGKEINILLKAIPSNIPQEVIRLYCDHREYKIRINENRRLQMV